MKKIEFRRMRFNDEIIINGWQIWAFVLLLAPSIAMYMAFIHAFFREGYRFAIAINIYNEAHIELVIITFIMILALVSVYKILRDWRRKYVRSV